MIEYVKAKRIILLYLLQVKIINFLGQFVST